MIVSMVILLTSLSCLHICLSFCLSVRGEYFIYRDSGLGSGVPPGRLARVIVILFLKILSILLAGGFLFLPSTDCLSSGFLSGMWIRNPDGIDLFGLCINVHLCFH